MNTKKMELNGTFLAGMACGVCLGLSVVALRKTLNRFTLKLKPSKNGASSKSAKKENLDLNDDDGEYKLVLVVRNDLKMGKGKVAAQCAHAAVGAYSKALKKDKTALQRWEYTGQAKIALKVESEDELLEIYDNAKNAGLVTSLIRDAGRTQIAPNTKTVLGIGPASKNAIDKVSGHLKLF